MAESKKKALFVTAPLVIAKRADGGDVYLYRGVPFVEDGLADGEADRLKDFLGDSQDVNADGTPVSK